MANQWGVSPLGNLSEFPVPQFHTGEGLAAIMALRQRQQEQIASNLTGAAETIATVMQQRKKDEMANALADQAATYYGIDVPRGEGLGSGELRLKMMDDLFKAKQAGQEAPLRQRILEARISRAEREPASGGGGGGTVTPTSDPNIWEDPVSHRRFLRGPRGGFTPLGGPAAMGGAGPAVKPRTQAQEDKLFLEEESLRAEAEKEKADNIKALIPNKPFSKQHELNPRAKLLGLDPVTGQPITTAAPKTELAPGYGVPTTTTTSTRQGAGPTDAAVAHLRQHPELATDFDAMYGSGMAAQYLGQ